MQTMAEYQGNTGSRQLCKWREDQGINANQASKRLGVERFTYIKWESGLGIPSIPNAVMLKQVTGIALESWVDMGSEAA